MTHTTKDGVPFSVSQPVSPVSEQFRIIRSRVVRALGSEEMSTLLVTSAFPGEGKTFVATNLAASIAKGFGGPVLLVDTDLRRPTLHKVFDLRKDQPGLTSYLAKGADVAKLIAKTRIPNLAVLPAGTGSREFAEGLPIARMRHLLEDVKALYGSCFVVLDSSPAHLFADSRLLAEVADGVVLVVKARETKKSEVRKALGYLSKDKMIGVVLNYCTVATKQHGKYYGYYGVK